MLLDIRLPIGELRRVSASHHSQTITALYDLNWQQQQQKKITPVRGC